MSSKILSELSVPEEWFTCIGSDYKYSDRATLRERNRKKTKRIAKYAKCRFDSCTYVSATRFMARHLVNYHKLHESCTLFCPFCLSERVYQVWGPVKGRSNFHTKRNGLKHMQNCKFRVEKIHTNKEFVADIIEKDRKVEPTRRFQCISPCEFQNEIPRLKSEFRKGPCEFEYKQSSAKRQFRKKIITAKREKKNK